eukprot:SAG25_NODE_1068_length_4135_cov_62.681863_1_plen_46_part_00
MQQQVEVQQQGEVQVQVQQQQQQQQVGWMAAQYAQSAGGWRKVKN